MRRGHRRLGRRSLVAVLLWIVLAAAPGSALAHDGVSRIVVEPPIAHPGDEVVVHGQFLWTDQPVTVAIVAGSGVARQVGTSTTLGDGSLETRVRVPVDLAPGRMEVVVTNSVGEIATVELVVAPVGLALPTGVAIALAIAVALLVAFAVGRLARRSSSRPIGPPAAETTTARPDIS